MQEQKQDIVLDPPKTVYVEVPVKDDAPWNTTIKLVLDAGPVAMVCTTIIVVCVCVCALRYFKFKGGRKTP